MAIPTRIQFLQTTETSKTTKLIIIFPQSYSCITTHTHTQPSQNGNPLRYCCPVTVAASKTATLVQTLDPSPFEKPPKRTRFTEVHNVCGTLPEPSAVWPKSASASEVCTHFRLEGGFPSRMKSSGYCLPKDFDHSEEALFSFWKFFFLFLEGKWSIFKYFAFSVNGLTKNYLNSLKRFFLSNRSLLFSQRKHLVETDIYAYLWLHPLKEFASPS